MHSSGVGAVSFIFATINATMCTACNALRSMVNAASKIRPHARAKVALRWHAGRVAHAPFWHSHFLPRTYRPTHVQCSISCIDQLHSPPAVATPPSAWPRWPTWSTARRRWRASPSTTAGARWRWRCSRPRARNSLQGTCSKCAIIKTPNRAELLESRRNSLLKEWELSSSAFNRCCGRQNQTRVRAWITMLVKISRCGLEIGPMNHVL